MNAALIARALAMLAEDPLRPLRDIESALQLHSTSYLSSYIGPGGECRKPEVIAAFPDFAANAASIRKSLEALKQPGEIVKLEASRGVKRSRTEGAAAGQSSQVSLCHQVFDALRDRIAQGKNVHGSVMKRWVSPVGWQRDNLAGRLSKEPDYPQWRSRIEPLAKQLGILGDDEHLPEPTAQRGVFQASNLVGALRQIHARQEATAEGRLDDPSLKQPLYQGAGTSKGSLANWVVAATGALKKPPASVAALPGYEQESGEIRRLLRALGHAKEADALPDQSGARQHISAATVARAFALIADNPQRSRGGVALDVGLSKETLALFIGPHGADVPRIARLRDYSEHFEAIRQALHRMGRADQANQLPMPLQHPTATAGLAGPSTEAGTSAAVLLSAQEFVQRAESTVNKIVAVAELLRQDPTMSMLAATQSVGASKRVIRALMDDRGALRDRPDIEQMLRDVNPVTSQAIGKLVARLAERLDSAATAPHQPQDEPPLKRLVLEAAGFAHDRVLLVDRNTMDPGPGTRDRKQAIYSQNPSLVREPRSYEIDRQRQPLRWLSTMLKARFPRAMEVQCYYDAPSRSVVVSANVLQANAEIDRFIKSGGLGHMLADQAPRPVDNTQRAERHSAKLLTRLDPAADPHPTQNAEEILAALAEGRIRVPRRGHSAVDLHAERRIARYLGDNFGRSLDRTQLAGTMRPCGTCADEIGAGPDEHRGPFWMSKASRAGTVSDADIDRQARAGVGTSITLARNGRLTFGHDTDSDSDA
ncbi:hypothetical protein [Methylibium rhizosphaerae]|uniref:hypothetical protein n=1 Tax=Methylibium rhizosphaerae TaxID=2570323 RepID=UPI001129E62B|nr:hypothetical protein [Methylibium rhizosphaerae]